MRVEIITHRLVICAGLVFLMMAAGSKAFVLISTAQNHQPASIALVQTGSEQFVGLPSLRQDALLQLLMFLAQRSILLQATSPARTPGDGQVFTSRSSLTESPLTTTKTAQGDIAHLKEAPALQEPEGATERTVAVTFQENEEKTDEPVVTADDLAPTTTAVPIAMTTEEIPAPEESVSTTTESVDVEEEETGDASPATNVSSSTEELKVEVRNIQVVNVATTPSHAEEETEEGAETDFQNSATEEPEVEENPAVTDGETETEEKEEEEEEPPAISLSFGVGKAGRLQCALSDGRCMRACPHSGDVIPGVSCGSDAQGHALVCCED